MIERFLFKRIELWIVLALLIVAIPTVMLFGWLVQSSATGQNSSRLHSLALAIARFPDPLVQLVFFDKPMLQPQLLTFSDFSGLRRYDDEFDDAGVLLVSAFSADENVSTAYLYDLRNQKILHEWVPPVEEINALTTHGWQTNLRLNYRTEHPLLLADGSILVKSGQGPLARISVCGELVWAIDRHFHHSIQMTSNNTVLVAIVVENQELENVAQPLRNDGWAEVDLDGNILGEWSVSEILERHGYGWLLHGVGKFEWDRIHLNDAEPILETDDFVTEGDVVLSARNISTVFLYRPSTDQVIWLSAGPWLNQHDVDYLGDGQFSVFDNALIRGKVKKSNLIGGNAIWRYDMKTGRASVLRDLSDDSINTKEQGLHRVLENGDIFIEETFRGLLHRVSATGLRWSYARPAGDGKIGALHWSRYLTKDEAQFPWLDRVNCQD